MKIPKKIKISGLTFKIEYTDTIIGDHDVLGRFDITTLAIQIKNNLSDELKEFVFIHEIIHVIDYFASVELEEKDVENIASRVYEFIENNKEIFKE